MKFPHHECGLELKHNPHKNTYETILEWLTEPNGGEIYGWSSPEARQQSINTNEIWTLIWYPNTPVGFYCIAAPTLGELLEFAAIVEKEDVR